MFEKIDPRYIISSHLNTLRKTGRKSRSVSDLILFFGFPLIVPGLLMLFFGLGVNESLARALITGLSIFAGLLFNLQVLVYDIVNRESKLKSKDATHKLRVTVLSEVFANVSYAILVALTVVLAVGVGDLTFSGGWLTTRLTKICHASPWLCNSSIYKTALDFLILFLTLNFVLTLLMVLRRVNFLLTSEFRTAQE